MNSPPILHSAQQVLITGCYRSGTEYITLLLNNHPDLCASMYVVNFMRFCYDRYNPVSEESNYSRLVFDASQRIRSRWHRNLNTRMILDECDQAPEVTYALLYDLLMSDLLLTDGVEAWAEKTQLVWTKIPAFLDMFPQGKVIHIVRDPRSVLASFKRYTYAPPPAYLGAIFNCYASMKSGLEYRGRFEVDRYCLVKYEDFITCPNSSIDGLISFLGLTTDNELLSEVGWKDALGNPWYHNSTFMPDRTQMNSSDRKATLERWKGNLPDHEIALCEAINAELLSRFGYQPSRISEDWPRMLRPLLRDDKLTRYLRQWVTESQGVEEFPTDPLLRENWEENVIS